MNISRIGSMGGVSPLATTERLKIVITSEGLPLSLEAVSKGGDAGQPGSLGERAYSLLKRGLKTGAYSPGQKITIRATASALGTSTMPVREALRRLVAEGALENQPNRSVRVPLMTPSRVREIARVRQAVEGLAAHEAASSISAATVYGLEQMQVEMAAAMDRRDIPAYMARNEEFHFVIYRAADMPVLLSIIDALWVRAGTYLTLLSPDMRGFDIHRSIIDALKANDALAAQQAMVRDIQRAADKLFGIAEDTVKDHRSS